MPMNAFTCSGPNAEDHFKRLKHLLATQRSGVLATSVRDTPYCSRMALVETADLTTLVMASPRDTRKCRNIAANPRVSLLVDDAHNDPADTHEAAAVTVTGLAREVGGAERSRLVALFVERHAHLAEFVEMEETAIIACDVREYMLVQDFQDVTVFTRT